MLCVASHTNCIRFPVNLTVTTLAGNQNSLVNCDNMALRGHLEDSCILKCVITDRLKGSGLDSFCTGEGPMVGFCECIMNL